MPGKRRRSVLFLLTAATSALAVLLVARFPERIIAGDPAVYRVRVVAILEGGWPYLDVAFEHLPVMLIPMFSAWWLGGAASQTAYVAIFAGLMGVSLGVTSSFVDVVGERFGSPTAGWRWYGSLLPMLPLVLFRNDPFAVLLAVVAMYLIVAGSEKWWLFAGAGALAKVWPVALALPEWRRDRRAAWITGCAGMAAVAISYMPGFVEGRNAFGIHTETLLGAVVGLWRTTAGEEAGVTLTTAAYIDVPGFVAAANAAVGLVVVGIGVWAVIHCSDRRDRMVAVGAVVAGIILTSPLFSLQYVLWLTPFVALSRRTRTLILGGLLGAFTMGLAWGWDEQLLDNPGFYTTVTIRNVLVLALALLLTRERIKSSVS